ncbi:unannotated protein [freshwater metagenome]|uniref:Unannotated protein n=1 Tax=freshwater metagenome TaxID=449393 RepID=A0A6J6U7A4_9ZZZZ
MSDKNTFLPCAVNPNATEVPISPEPITSTLPEVSMCSLDISFAA